MRILMLSPTLPWPLDSGDKIRIHHVLKELCHSHEVTLVSLVWADGNKDDESVIRQLCPRLITVPIRRSGRWAIALRSLFSLQPYRAVKLRQPGLHHIVGDFLGSGAYDLFWVHLLDMCVHFPASLPKRTLVILDQQNADELEWDTFVQAGSLPVRAFARLNLWKLRRFQDKALKQVDVVLSVSDSDADFMRRRVPASCQVWTAPNGVDTEHFVPISPHCEETKDVIILCGSMDVTMNADAAVRFTREIFPAVRASVPDAELWIVGRNPTHQVRDLADTDGITVTGTVPDVRPYYQRAKVAIAPYRYGGGTKLKVLEAMAMGVPVVATGVGSQGIEATAGQHLFVEDGNEAFAKRLIELLLNPDLRRAMSIEARRLVELKYSWTGIMGEASRRLQRLVEARQPNRQTGRNAL